MPTAHAQLLSALDFALGPTREIVIVGERADAEARSMAGEVARRFLPRKVILWNAPDEAKTLHRLAPFVKSQTPVAGASAAYLCENYACRAPVTSAAELALLLDAPIPTAAS